jgi:enolase
MPTWAAGRRASAGAHDEHPERRQTCGQQRRFPGVHGHADRGSDFAEALRYGAETFHALKKILQAGSTPRASATRADFAPNLKSNDEACEVIIEAIEGRGLQARQGHRHRTGSGGQFVLRRRGVSLGQVGPGQEDQRSDDLPVPGVVAKYPIVSIEDGLAENDWEGFRTHTAALGGAVQIVGDDIYVTNTQFIARGIQEKSTNAVLIKLNQIGTVTETIEAIQMCQQAGWGYVVSHRSGETEDAFLADFAVAMGGGQIKTGSACRSERIAKYNRLLEIEAELGKAAVLGCK